MKLFSTIIAWNSVFSGPSEYDTLPFADPHWNSYLDVTGDCYGDVVIVNSNNIVEFWIGGSGNFKLQNSSQFSNIVSLSFADLSTNNNNM